MDRERLISLHYGKYLMIIHALPGREYSRNLEGEDWKDGHHCHKIGKDDFGEQLIICDNKQ